MGKVYERIDGRLREWIERQPMFFVATAPSAPDGHINLSPKGGQGSLAVLDGATLAWLDLTGSGIETLAHLRENGRITLMWCAFEDAPKVVRIHGTGQVHERGTARFAELATRFPDGGSPGARSVVIVRASRISDSCGFGVPLMSHAAERDLLDRFSSTRGVHGMDTYRRERNATSIDGLPGFRPGG